MCLPFEQKLNGLLQRGNKDLNFFKSTIMEKISVDFLKIMTNC